MIFYFNILFCLQLLIDSWLLFSCQVHHTLSQQPVSVLKLFPCICSWGRASFDSLTQKKAAQWGDAKLTQLLTQNDEVRDSDLILLAVFKLKVGGRKDRWTETKKVGEMCVWERCCCWWEFGWVGWGKLRLAEERGKKLRKRKKERRNALLSSDCFGWHAVSC